MLKALGSRANVAITDAIEGDNALYNPDEDVIYISNGVLDGSDFNNEDIARAVALHEVTHKAEGTRAYLDMVDEVQKIVADENAPADVKALVGDRVQRRKKLVKSYWDKNLSREQNRYVVDTELISNMLGDLLGNSYFVERMAKRQSSAWERFVMAMKAADAGKAAGISKESQKYLSGLYKAYVKAVDKAGGGVKLSSITDEEEKEKADAAEKGVDSVENERYNKKRKYKQISNQEYAIISSRIMADNSYYMARNEDLPQYGVVPSNNYYYVYENFSPGHFGVLKQIAITDANKEYINLIEKVIGGNNGKSVIGSTSELDRVLQILKNQARNHRGNNASNSEGRSNSENGGIPLGKSERDGIRTSRDGDENRGNGQPETKVKDERHSIKHPSFSEKEILSNIDALADMSAVISIDSIKLEKTGKKPKDLFIEFFDSLGNNIYSDVFGDIALSKASAKSEIRHGLTAEKIASIEAIPSVIKEGVVIFSKTKKDSDVERIVVAAPIKIGRTDYYMGVMLQRDTQSQRLYLHNVVAVKEEEALSSQDDSLTNWSDEDNSRLFITSILQKAVNVKIKRQKSAKQALGNSDERSSKQSPVQKPKNERSSKQKYYLKKDASAVIYHALSKHLRVSDSYSKLLRATAKEAKQKLYDALNNVEGEERNAVAFEIADYLIDNAVIKAFESNPNAKANAETLAKFDVYLHKIDLDSIKEEIKKHFGKDLTPYGLWGKHKDSVGVAPDAIVSELAELGVIIDAKNPADIFFEIYDTYKKGGHLVLR